LRKQKRLAALAAMAVLVGVVSAPVSAGAAESRTYEIHPGADLSSAPGFIGRFFPSTLNVHVGDVLHFTTPEVMLLPQHRQEPDDGMDAFIIRTESGWKFNFELFEGTLPEEGCGTTAANACVYDGSQYILAPDPEATGVEYEDGLYVKVAGGLNNKTFFASNLMTRFRVNVDNSKPQSPAVDPTAAAKIAGLNEDALALHRKLNNRQTFHRNANGKKVWDAYAGFETRDISLFAMYPKRLTIRKGQRVQWHFSQQNFEPHTVSISAQKAAAMADKVFEQIFGPGGDGTIPTHFMEATGNGRYEGLSSPLEHSGLRGDKNAYTDDAYNLRFTAKSPRSGFDYMCVLHAGVTPQGRAVGMVGKVVVTD
jgi:plastocyanin